jgi:hypothetical protein
MALKLSARVGDTIAIGGPTTLRIESKSGQVVGLVFGADRSVPIRLLETAGGTTGAAKPRNAPVGIGPDDEPKGSAPGLKRK